ncbi:hypothetical protein PSEUBRA_001707 [Kalmanozyma brasiliensis GHG001]|uniref:uncharacterized protein n=1 Tax=Kalmanozyma brasiliensis (strain GHG001) TaxID=1365824 RepID=UPI002867D6AB|nr:uncharacterized protein PSEUBRA_001707 [Kalmanozyma brasiliensis GHG001]EST08633.2 hypothetical protein PSEUBRA_001707 [Kalmanozyma brasiliensis GHG001]
MSSFYNSRKSFDTSDRGFTRSPFFSGKTSSPQNELTGGAPLHAMMVPGVAVPSSEQTTSEKPSSKFQAFIGSKRAKSTASPPKKDSRIIWADQIRKASPTAQPLTYTKASDRLAMAAPPASPPADASPPRPRGGMLRKASLDLLRSSPDTGRSTTPLPPADRRPSISGGLLRKASLDLLRSSPDTGRSTTPLPNISSPIMTSSTLTASPAMSSRPLPRRSMDASWSRPRPEPLQLAFSANPFASSSRSIAPLPLTLSTDSFSEELFNSFGKRASASSGSSGRAPGPSDLLAVDLPLLLQPQAGGPPSIADTYSVRSRRDSLASSIDLDPAVLRTPTISDNQWQAQVQQDRAAFLAEYGLDQDDHESDTDGSVYSNDDDASVSLPSFNLCPPNTLQEYEMPPPVFQRLDADLLSVNDHGDGMNGTGRFMPEGRLLPPLEIASLPREKEEMIRKSRARLISPRTFKKAFSIKRRGSDDSPSADSTPSLTHSSSDEASKSSDASVPPRMPGLGDREAQRRFSDPSSEEGPTTPTAPSMPMPLFNDALDKDTSMSPVFSSKAASFTSESSRGVSSLSSSSSKRHRVGTPGLTKTASSLSKAGSAATIDPHFARVQTRARSNGSIISQTPSDAPSSNGRRSTRKSGKSGRTRITDSMPSFAHFGSALQVPAVSSQRRPSTRSTSSEDSHSNASSSSNFDKVSGGSSDDGTVASSVHSVSSSPVKGVLRKRSPSSADSSVSASKKEVSFELPASVDIETVDEIQEETEVLEHEQKQRSRLALPPMKLQVPKSDVVEDVQAAGQSQNDIDITCFLSTFGANVKSVESLEVLDNIHAGASDWPRREDWNSLPAYLVAYATTFLSAYTDDSATLVYSDARLAKDTTVSAPSAMSQNPLFASIVRSIYRIASWEQPAVSAGVSSAYAYTWSQGKLAGVGSVGLALLAAVQSSSQQDSTVDAKELGEAYSQIASVLLGSDHTRERVRNLMLSRSPKASLRVILCLTALLCGVHRFGSGLIFSLPGLFVGLALFVWLPAILCQPSWAPEWLKQGNPLDALLLYDVPTDTQHAILTMRRRAASGEQLVHREAKEGLTPTDFDHRVSQQDLLHAGDVLDGAFFGTHEGKQGHLVVLPSRVVFRALTAPVEVVSLRDALKHECRISFDARLEKVVGLTKVGTGLEMRLKNGQTCTVENVQSRDEAFNRLLALAPQRWH